MKGYLHPMCVEEYGPELGPGAALLLKEASLMMPLSETPPCSGCHLSKAHSSFALHLYIMPLDIPGFNFCIWAGHDAAT